MHCVYSSLLVVKGGQVLGGDRNGSVECGGMRVACVASVSLTTQIKLLVIVFCSK